MSGPYAQAAGDYWSAGWRGVIPLPPREKAPQTRRELEEFTGWTGRTGRDPSWPDVMAWAEDKPDGNICLHLPDGVLGLDIDEYVDPDGTVKRGGQSLASGERLWGELPATWRTTSRDNVSGIRLFRVPPGLRWPGTFGPGTETIHVGHRYVVAPPSIHPDTGKAYRWINPEGVVSMTPPRVGDLPWLPTTWVVGLTENRTATAHHEADMNDAEVREWLIEHNHGTPCHPLAEVVDEQLKEMRGGAHESLRYLMRIVGLGAEGHDGLNDALRTVHDAFVATVRARRGGTDVAEHEWRRSLGGAVRKVVGEMAKTGTATSRIDPCEVLVSPAPETPGMPPQSTEPGSALEPTGEVSIDDSLDIEAPRGDEDDAGGETPEQARERLIVGKMADLRIVAEAKQRLAAEDAPKLEWLDADAFLDGPEPEPLIPRLLYKDSLARIYGKAGCGKSFLSIDLAYSLATGRAWAGAELERTRVAYVMAEGQRVNTRRSKAWLDRHGVDRDELRGWFHAVPHKVLLTESGVAELVAKVAEHKIGLVILDTKNAMMVGDENSSEDFAILRRALDTIREATDACVVLIDHTGYGDTGRARGSSAGEAGMDTEIKVENDGQAPPHITVTVTRDKGDETGAAWDFFLRTHPIDDERPPAVLVPMGEDIELPERKPLPEEVETSWQGASVVIPVEVLHYTGEGKAGVPDLARYMAHDAGVADPARIGRSRAEATAALSEKTLGKGRGHSRSTVNRAWSVLREMGYISPADGKWEINMVAKHVWSTT